MHNVASAQAKSPLITTISYDSLAVLLCTDTEGAVLMCYLLLLF
jgi:hypothetical protein